MAELLVIWATDDQRTLTLGIATIEYHYTLFPVQLHRIREGQDLKGFAGSQFWQLIQLF